MSFSSLEISPLSLACEIIKDKFYFLTHQNVKLRNTADIYYFCTDEQFVYKNFNQDFGPLNLAIVCRYCSLVNKKIELFEHVGKKLCHVTSQDPKKRTNAAFLAGCFAIFNGKSPEETVRCLITQPKLPIYLPFRDVSIGPSVYNLGILDCFKALVKAKHLGIFDFNTFDVDQYDYLEKMVNGDMSWIIPGKFLALPGPNKNSYIEKGFVGHTPDFYIPYFLQNNITSVIRLNKEAYQAKMFQTAGIDHFTIYFPDGSVPSVSLVHKFIDICEKAPGAIAVHCKAGLGRTGTMIGCYMMKNMRFTAAEAIAWMRMTRPGSVIGMQQIFLNDIQKRLWEEGKNGEEPKQQLINITASLPQQLQEQFQHHHAEGGPTRPQRIDLWERVSSLQQSSKSNQPIFLRQHLQRHINNKKFFKSNVNHGTASYHFPMSVSESNSLTQGDVLNQLKVKRQLHSKKTSSFGTGRCKLPLRQSQRTETVDDVYDHTAMEGLSHGPCDIEEKDMETKGEQVKRKTFAQERFRGEELHQKMEEVERHLYNNNNITDTRENVVYETQFCDEDVFLPCQKYETISKNVDHHDTSVQISNFISGEKLDSHRTKTITIKMKNCCPPPLADKSEKSRRKVINNENIIAAVHPVNMRFVTDILTKVNAQKFNGVDVVLGR